MKIAFLIFVLPAFALAERSHLYTFGRRQLDDHAFVVEHQSQGPFNEPQNVTVNFEYILEGKYFTALIVEGEPLFVCDCNFIVIDYYYAEISSSVLGIEIIQLLGR